jgi:acetoin utilization deacetylase AcuC-like enzyme
MAPTAGEWQRCIRDLNDQFRTNFAGGRVLMTAGVQALEDDQRARVVTAVRDFSDFTSANDPYGEHHFGRLVVSGQGYLFKIDAYDLDYRYHSPDPADEAVTTRVMTIMREDEY